jgi:hypothetical protein
MSCNTKLNTYPDNIKVMGTLWKHPRPKLKNLVKICSGFVNSRKTLLKIPFIKITRSNEMMQSHQRLSQYKIQNYENKIIQRLQNFCLLR